MLDAGNIEALGPKVGIIGNLKMIVRVTIHGTYELVAMFELAGETIAVVKEQGVLSLPKALCIQHGELGIVVASDSPKAVFNDLDSPGI